MRDVSEATKVRDEIAKTNDDVADVADNIECQDLEVTDCFDSNRKSVPASTNKPASSSDKVHSKRCIGVLKTSICNVMLYQAL